jgi:lipopolysaccharide export system permease protein
MPVLWRYLLRSYFRVLILCVVSFIAILLVTRFQEIAQFAASGAPLKLVCLFMLYQIPYILPLAIPVSCLIAAMLLFQHLSQTHELTALRASGIGLKTIAAPLVLAGCLLALTNFTIASEIGPRCRGLSKELIFEMTAVNPLALFQKDTLIKLKDTYVDMKTLRTGKSAKDVILVLNNRNHQRLGIMTAKELFLEGTLLNGKQVSFISSVNSKQDLNFDHLVIENQAVMSTQASSMSQLTQNTDWYFNYDYMPLRMILAKRAVEKSLHPFSMQKAELEIVRRVSISLAALTFTLIGIAFGMTIGRNGSKKGIAWALSLAASFMLCFIMAKSMHHSVPIASLLYLLPHPIIAFCALQWVGRAAKGVE